MYNKFQQELQKFVFEENHIHKYGGTEQIVGILNGICLELQVKFGTTIYFTCENDDEIGMTSDFAGEELSMLPIIYKQFKKCYRCNESCWLFNRDRKCDKHEL